MTSPSCGILKYLDSDIGVYIKPLTTLFFRWTSYKDSFFEWYTVSLSVMVYYKIDTVIDLLNLKKRKRRSRK